MLSRITRLLQLLLLALIASDNISLSHGVPHQILLDSDIDTDDYFALLYLLKLNRSEFNLKAITINANTWSNAGHAINHVYDILYMMGRDDIPVGIGGDGGILYNGTVLPNVGGYLPLIEQDSSTIGGCRYRQTIPPGAGGRLDVDTAYGVRKDFLPQGKRRYVPLRQPTAQEVMIDALSSGPTIVIIIGAHTNFALLLMTQPHLKKNVEHIYVMGGGIHSLNPTGCCAVNASSCTLGQCGDHGNLFTAYQSNPVAEFNIFGDPFSAYQVFHSGLPITLVPLDATNTILIDEEFFAAFQNSQKTYEAQYAFESLKMIRDTWFDDEFYTSYFMWDSLTMGIATSSIRNGHLNSDANEFAELMYMNVTVVTSNKPYGLQDGSNPFFDNRKVPKFHLKKGGIHSGHVQKSSSDPFCFMKKGKGKCQDGYTKEENSSEGVKILVATKAKPDPNINSSLGRVFYISFLNVLNSPHQTAKFNLKTEFPYYKEVFYMRNVKEKRTRMPVIFDMDMSPGDIVTLLYLLKMPAQLIDLKAITINANGWTDGASIDMIYDILHMMGRDDIPVGLGEFFALNQPYASLSAIGDCKYSKAIPYGSGGLLDTDNMFGLARDLPHSPRRYTAHNSVKFGAIRNTEHPELRQPRAKEIWQNITNGLESGSKLTILATGPLTNVANFISSSAKSKIKEVYIVGGHFGQLKGNLFSIPSNKRAEFNFFLDPLAAKQVLSSGLNITLVPLNVQRNVSSLSKFKAALQQHHRPNNMTPEAAFVCRVTSRMLQLSHRRHFYKHLSMFLGEVVGGVILAQEEQVEPSFEWMKVKVMASGDVASDGWTVDDKHNHKARKIRVVKEVDSQGYYEHIAKWLNKHNNQSAVIAGFNAQKRRWNTPPS